MRIEYVAAYYERDMRPPEQSWHHGPQDRGLVAVNKIHAIFVHKITELFPKSAIEIVPHVFRAVN
jgi:hypothetical protein